MQEIYIEPLLKVIKNKSTLEKELNVRITNKGKNVFVDGSAEKEFIAIEVLRAINIGFSIDQALLLKQNNTILQILNIKDITKRKDLGRVRGRIIGTDSRTINTIKKLTTCDIALHDNKVGIIGNAEEIEDAIQAVTSIIQGSKQGNVYSRLERQRKRKRLEGKLDIRNELK